MILIKRVWCSFLSFLGFFLLLITYLNIINSIEDLKPQVMNVVMLILVTHAIDFLLSLSRSRLFTVRWIQTNESFQIKINTRNFFFFYYSSCRLFIDILSSFIRIYISRKSFNRTCAQGNNSTYYWQRIITQGVVFSSLFSTFI
jgi:hypothetical protein